RRPAEPEEPRPARTESPDPAPVLVGRRPARSSAEAPTPPKSGARRADAPALPPEPADGAGEWIHAPPPAKRERPRVTPVVDELPAIHIASRPAPARGPAPRMVAAEESVPDDVSPATEPPHAWPVVARPAPDAAPALPIERRRALVAASAAVPIA